MPPKNPTRVGKDQKSNFLPSISIYLYMLISIYDIGSFSLYSSPLQTFTENFADIISRLEEMMIM